VHFGGAVLRADVLHIHASQSFYYVIIPCLIGGGIIVFGLSRLLPEGIRMAVVGGYGISVVLFLLQFLSFSRSKP
jgi:hypothetical protein